MSEGTINPENISVAPEAVQVNSVREALKAIGAGKVAVSSASEVEQCARIAKFMDSHPIRGGIIQTLILHKYQHETGDVGAIDWQKFSDWIKNGGLQNLMQVIMTIIMLFGG